MDEVTLQTHTKSLNPEYLQFISGSFSEETAKLLAKKVRFKDEQTVILENGISLYLLLLLDTDELIAFIARECGAPVQIATELAYALQVSLPAEYVAMHEAAFTALNSDIDVDAGSTGHSLDSDIAEAEAALEAIPRIRTMAQDMQQAKEGEPVYTSTQASILQKSTPIPPPQWGSAKK